MKRLFLFSSMVFCLFYAASLQAVIPVEFVSQFGGSSYVVAVSGDYAYVGMGPSLLIMDISVPSNPVKLSQVVLQDTVLDLALSGHYAYIAEGSYGLAVIDISNPSSASYVGGYDTSGRVFDVAVSGNYAYVADYCGGLVTLRVGYPGDCEPDGDVDFDDLKRFTEHWLNTGCVQPYGCEGIDLDNDTDVDFSNFSIFAHNWLK